MATKGRRTAATAAARPENAFGERHRKALSILEHRKRSEYLRDQDRLLATMISQKYMKGIW
jgi:hypothetical protein